MIREFIKGKRKALAGEDKKVGIGGFKLFARVSDTVSYSSMIPTYTLEDGTQGSDDIIKEPLSINITGVVSDEHIELAETPEVIQSAQNLSGKVEAFLPNRTQSQVNKIKSIGVSIMSAVDRVDSVIDVGSSAYGLVSGGNTEKKLREKFVDFIEAVYYGNQLIDVDVDYRTHSSMAIKSLEIRTDNKVNEIAFDISLQQVQIREAVYVDISEFYSKPSPNAADSVAGLSDKGAKSAQGGKVKSLASSILGR